jgi:triosephosphate isomerase
VPLIIKKKISQMADSRKYIIGGNWKSNGSVDFVRQQCTEVLNHMNFD